MGDDERDGGMVDAWLALGPAARLLVVNQAAINLGFFMVLPYLAAYLRDDLGLAAATVGLVLGARTLAQQGLFLPSGALVDRFGPRPAIVAGLGLRIGAFALLAVGTSAGAVVAGVLAIGVAGALFNPGLRTYLALEERERRAQAFALLEVAGHVGSLSGPAVGALLLLVDFRLSCAIAAVVFALLTAAQLLLLPARRTDGDPTPVLRGLGRVLGDRRLAAVVLAASVHLALFNQLYLTLPLEAVRVTGREWAVGAVFLVSGVTGIAIQVRVAAWCRRRWTSAGATAAGLGVMAAAFGPVAASAATVPTAGAGLDVAALMVRALPLLVGVLLLACGLAMVMPFVVPLVADEVGDRLIGTAYGWYYLVSALVTLVVAWGSGALLDLGGVPGRTASVLLLVVLGLLGAGSLALLDRRAAR